VSDDRPVFGTLGFYQEVADALNSDPAWLEMATPITYSMIYFYDLPINKAFFINFDQGKITEVAQLASADERPADFVITGPPDAWKAVIQKSLTPTAAMATGKLKVQGKQTILLRHMKKFSYLIDKMTTLDTDFG
jgi:putative sterol carrier protein